MLKIIQMNIGRNEKEQMKLIIEADKMQADVVCIQEPYTNKCNNQVTNINANYNQVSTSPSNLRAKSAIMIRKGIDFVVDTELSNENNTIILISEYVITSSYLNLREYLPPNENEERDTSKDLICLQAIIEKYRHKKQILTMDANARQNIDL